MSERALIEEQYRTTSNLRARIALHDRFSTNPGSWARFVFGGYDFGPRADVLEVGCGDAMIWHENDERVPAGWRLTLTDLSAGMVGAARDVLGDRADYAVADVEDLPFADDSFDAVIANHMLFHVEDRRRALGEIRRVLRAGGSFAATTIGANHLRELSGLAPPPSDGQWAKTRGRFPIETVPEELAPYFARVEIERYPDALAVTEVEPLLDFLRSRGDVSDDDLDRARVRVERAIAHDGAFHVTKDTARVFAR